eukprot:gene6130-7636_t
MKERIAGGLFLLGMVAGIFSVAPSIDSVEYLSIASKNVNQTIVASISQFIMSFTYIGIGILLYPIIKRIDNSLSLGFLSMRIVATSIVIIGTIIDYINHVFMVLTICTSNIMFYLLMLKSQFIPRWISIFGLIGCLLAEFASILVLFKVVDVITTEYILLNVPAALQELIIGSWLLLKGFSDFPTNTTLFKGNILASSIGPNKSYYSIQLGYFTGSGSPSGCNDFQSRVQSSSTYKFISLGVSTPVKKPNSAVAGYKVICENNQVHINTPCYVKITGKLCDTNPSW